MLDILKSNLEKRGFSVKLFEKGSDAVSYLNEIIDATSVGIGGSVTVKELGLFDVLKAHNEVWWHGDGDSVKAYGAQFIRDKEMMTETYICSANAVSMDGTLVNIDGMGNRIASTAYGHKRVFYVIGKNKLTEDLHSAILRAKNIAAPKNAKRLGVKTPCAVNGDKCYNCNSPEKICRGILITEAPFNGQSTEVILIDEALGY